MRDYKVGDWVAISGKEIPSNASHIGIQIGDVGIVREVWTNPHNKKKGCNVELSAFYTDITIEDLREDGEFDEEQMSYQFYASELRFATLEEIENNNILEVD